jgi:hypothetical protein
MKKTLYFSFCIILCSCYLETLTVSVQTLEVNNISTTKAECFASIQFTEDIDILEKGFCYDTLSKPTTSDFKIKENSIRTDYSCELERLKPDTKYYIRAYVILNSGTYYGNELTFTTETYELGQSFQGGIIFYIDDTRKHGLITTSTDISDGIKWYKGTYVLTGATDKSIGSGLYNTIKIVNKLGDGNYAAKICYDLVHQGYSDWYLPSQYELDELINNYLYAMIDRYNSYWSSTESGGSGLSYGAYWRNHSFSGHDNEYSNNRVRAIRAF